MSCYVLGDLHGCHAELRQLLKKIDYSPTHDKLLLTGDLVGRGPQSLAVVRTIKELQEKNSVILVLGNHDLHCIAFSLHNPTALRHPDPSFTALLAAPDCADLMDWLRHQPLAHYEPTYDCLLVHAGIPPLWSFEQALGYAAEMEQWLRLPRPRLAQIIGTLYGNQPSLWDEELLGLMRFRLISNYLTRMRLCNQDGRLLLEYTGPPQRKRRYRPWFEFSRSHTGTILFGHWAALNGITHQEDRIALDYGCVWGRRLAALRLEDRQLFTIPALKGSGR